MTLLISCYAYTATKSGPGFDLVACRIWQTWLLVIASWLNKCRQAINIRPVPVDATFMGFKQSIMTKRISQGRSLRYRFKTICPVIWLEKRVSKLKAKIWRREYKKVEERRQNGKDAKLPSLIRLRTLVLSLVRLLVFDTLSFYLRSFPSRRIHDGTNGVP